MPPTFRRRSAAVPPSSNPERLFDDLPRTRDRVPSLWAHQADMLRRYHSEHINSPDVALELPTGAGKTLPALLIAEWRRTSLGHRVAYACPNHQLAHQVAGHAAQQGIDAVTLVGSHRGWDTADAARYDGARALAITTYSAIFNSKPALSDPQTLLFDDAHAAEQFVSSAWSVDVSRRDENLYGQLIRCIRSELPGLLVQRLESANPDPIARRDVKLLPLAALRRRAESIDRVLATVEGDLRYRYTMIREHLDRCLLFFSWDGILIRPYLPPTGEHGTFANAEQRLYISATLGEGGELERAFGRAPIVRLPVPDGWDKRGSGRRFIIFPELLRGVEPRSITRSLVAQAGKALVIAPSDRALDNSVRTLVPDKVPLFSKGDIEQTLETFGSAPTGVLALANRYDGIDLADDRCHMTVLDGAPRGAHLQERFLIDSLRAGRVLEERLRTRIVQGAGRCTRGLTDFSVVVVLGDDLTRFFSRSEVRKALRAEMQAEIEFGFDNSDVDQDELSGFVTSFLDQDDVWQDEAEPVIAELRRQAERVLPPGTEALADSAAEEVKAWDAAWRGDNVAASRAANELCRHLVGDDLRPYRALWLYFASAWLQAASEERNDEELAAGARQLLRSAHAVASRTSWLREIAPLPQADEILEPVDEHAVETAATAKTRTLSAIKFAKQVEEMVRDLSGLESVPYERGLTTLGMLLGAEAFKPPGQGRADSAWLYGSYWWLTLEAKSESKDEGLLSMDNVRQTNTHLKSIAADRDTECPSGSLSVIVTPKQLAHPDAVAIADAHVYFCSPGDVLRLAHDAVEGWAQIRAKGRDLTDEALLTLIRTEFREQRLLPSQLGERLAERPVAG